MTLIDFAKTERQREVVELSEKMSYRQAAKSLGISVGAFSSRLLAVRRRAALQGWSPDHDMNKSCPETHYVKGTSTLYGKDGEQKLQWVKTNTDQDRLKLLAEELSEAICQSVKPAKRKTAKGVGGTESDKLAVYPIGDAHIGLYCWEEDAEEDYDLNIARELMVKGFDRILDATPPAREALIINLGDWFHTDSEENRTRRSGHALDVDTRWAKVTRVGVWIMRYVIDRALEKHHKVRVINSIGNHDDQTSIMLSMVLEAYYSNTKNLTVDTSPDAFHWHEWGNNLIGVHHGHQCKPADLYRVMAEDKREECGRCQHRYWYCGHVHHGEKVDVGGQVIESFRTLIPGDKYAHTSGYRSPRDICSIVLDKKHGECFRSTVNVEAIR